MRQRAVMVLALAAVLSGAPSPAPALRFDSAERVERADIPLLPLAAGVGALALSVALLVVAAVRRGHPLARPVSDDRAAAMLRRRTERLGRMHMEDDPTVASRGVKPHQRDPGPGDLPPRRSPPPG